MIYSWIYLINFIFNDNNNKLYTQVQADKQLWEHKAKQILNRDDPVVQDDNSNPDDTDTPDGGAKDSGTGNNIEKEQT